LHSSCSARRDFTTQSVRSGFKPLDCYIRWSCSTQTDCSPLCLICRQRNSEFAISEIKSLESGVEASGATGWDGHRAYELNVATLLSLHRREPVVLPLLSADADAERAAVVQY
jgi:hypothetical protein